MDFIDTLNRVCVLAQRKRIRITVHMHRKAVAAIKAGASDPALILATL